MENEKHKIKEPYTPENTPTPPQIIDPTERNGEHDEKAPLKAGQGPTSEAGIDRNRKKPTDSAKEKQASAETTANPGKEKR